MSSRLKKIATENNEFTTEELENQNTSEVTNLINKLQEDGKVYITSTDGSNAEQTANMVSEELDKQNIQHFTFPLSNNKYIIELDIPEA